MRERLAQCPFPGTHRHLATTIWSFGLLLCRLFQFALNRSYPWHEDTVCAQNERRIELMFEGDLMQQVPDPNMLLQLEPEELAGVLLPNSPQVGRKLSGQG